MKLKIQFVSLVIALLFVSINLYTQPLPDLLKIASKNHPRIKSIEETIQRAIKMKASSYAFPAPSIGFMFSNVPIHTANIFDKAIGQKISLKQKIPIAKLEYSARVEDAMVSFYKTSLTDYQSKLEEAISHVYVRIWITRETIKIYNDMIRNADNILYNYNNNYIHGEKQAAGFLQVIVKKESLQSTLFTLKQKEQADIIELNVLLGREDMMQQVNVDTLGIQRFLNQARLRDSSVLKNSELRQKQASINVNTAKQERENQAIVPDVTLQGSVMRMPVGGFVTTKSLQSAFQNKFSSDAWMYSLGVSVTLPFVPWALNGATNKVDALDREKEALEYEKEAKRQELGGMLLSEKMRLQATKEVINTLSFSVIPAYRASVEQATLSLFSDANAMINLLDMIHQMLIRKVELVEAWGTYFTTLVKIKKIKS